MGTALVHLLIVWGLVILGLATAVVAAITMTPARV
jgi:hypothetical protein